MSQLNIKKDLLMIKKEIEKEWPHLGFEYSLKEKEATATASVTLKNHDDDIRLIISIYPGGGSAFRVVFDKLEITDEILGLLNDYNEDDPFFNAYVREDGFLELSHFFVCYDEAMFKSYAGEFLYRFVDLADHKILRQLTQYTHD